MHHEYCGVAQEDFVTGIVCDEERVKIPFGSQGNVAKSTGAQFDHGFQL